MTENIYPAWITQTKADKIFYLSKGLHAHLIIFDLGSVENISAVFQNRTSYLTKYEPNNHSTSVASIAVGDYKGTKISNKIYGLSKGSTIISDGMFEPPPQITCFINIYANKILQLAKLDSTYYIKDNDFSMTNIINVSIGNEELLKKFIHYILSFFVDCSDAIKLKFDLLAVISAGNSNNEITTQTAVDPASLRSKLPYNTIVVAAMEKEYKESLWSQSNYGKQLVDIAAPGENLPVILDNKMHVENHSGTTYAAAIVSATAGLMLSCNPRFTGKQLKNMMIEEADTVDALKNKVIGGKVLNVERAVKKACSSAESVDEYSYDSLSELVTDIPLSNTHDGAREEL